MSPIPLDRYFHAADALQVLGTARKLAILDVLADEGTQPLGWAVYRGGLPTHGSLKDAAELEVLGLVTIERRTGRNLSEILTITPRGLQALDLARVWAD